VNPGFKANNLRHCNSASCILVCVVQFPRDIYAELPGEWLDLEGAARLSHGLLCAAHLSQVSRIRVMGVSVLGIRPKR
jgi:hypothetical protein